MKKNPVYLIFSLIILFTLPACGSGSSDRVEDDENTTTREDYDVSENSVVTDDGLSQEAVSASLYDANEMLTNSSGSTSTASLQLFGSSSNNSSWEKSCDDDDEESATVTIKGELDHSRTLEGTRRKVTFAVTGSNDTTRLWTMESDGTEINCHDNDKRVDIDWKSFEENITLKVTFDRDRKRVVEFTNKVKDTTFSKTRSFSADGTREITFTDYSADEDAGTVTRKKSVTSDVTRTHTRENSKGTSKQMLLQMKTDDDAPLIIEVVRDSSDGSLKSKTIESGTLIGTRNLDGKVISEFSGLKFEITDSTCSYTEGSVTSTFYKADSDDAAKTLKFEVVDGDYTLTDVDTGEVKTDFEFEGCNYREIIKE